VTPKNIRWVVGAATALLLLGGAVAGFRPREPECVRDEPARPLNLSLASDRTHLRADLDDIRAIASGFSSEVSRRPMLSDSIDAQAGAKTAPVRALAWCEEVLQQQLTTTHGMSLEALLAHMPAANLQTADDQAEAKRASVTESSSSVVSRPPR